MLGEEDNAKSKDKNEHENSLLVGVSNDSITPHAEGDIPSSFAIDTHNPSALQGTKKQEQKRRLTSILFMLILRHLFVFFNFKLSVSWISQSCYIGVIFWVLPGSNKLFDHRELQPDDAPVEIHQEEVPETGKQNGLLIRAFSLWLIDKFLIDRSICLFFVNWLICRSGNLFSSVSD